VKKQKTGALVAFLLFTLLLVKVSAFHVYLHQDDATNEIENCQVCHIVAETQSLEHHNTPPLSVDPPRVEIVLQEPILQDNIIVTSSFLQAKIFSRPPPFLG